MSRCKLHLSFAERNYTIFSDYSGKPGGPTLAVLGEKYGICGTRVRQIVASQLHSHLSAFKIEGDNDGEDRTGDHGGY